MKPEDRKQIEEHVSSCPKCRHAKRIGALCPVGRKWLDAQLLPLISEIREEPNGLGSVASSA